ncbi:MAG: hypothetical protein Q8R20_00445, partial [Nanoarchaeota archaeon]|nr:hypothetical protein [Nanoarchaeota archaeon]
IPLRNNPGGVPLLLVTLTLLVLAGVFTKRWVVKMAIAALPLLLLSFYSPPIFRAVNALMASLEDRTATTIERIGEGTKAYNPRLRREKQMIEEAPKPPDKSLLSPGDRVMLAEKDGVMKWVVMDKDGNISDAPQSSLSELRLLPGVHTKSNPLRVDLPKGGSESKAVVLPSDSRVEFNGPTVRTVLYRKGGRWARLTATEFQQILDGTHPTIKGVPIELKFKSHPGMGGVVTVW